MMSEFKDLFAQSTSRGDTATILIAGAAGFVVDAGLNAIGFLSPGAVGATSASAALGVKKGWEARREAKKAAAAGVRAAAHTAHAEERAHKLLAFFDERDYYPGLELLSAELALHKEEVIDDARLDKAVEDALQGFRDWVAHPERQQLQTASRRP